MSTRSLPLVGVDVFSWLTACITLNTNVPNVSEWKVPIEGIYRHAERFSTKFLPVAYISAADYEAYGMYNLNVAVSVIEKALNKNIVIFRSIEDIVKADVRVWLSIAVDSACPILDKLPQSICRVAVLHDTMAYQGLFGAGNEYTFKYGINNNDVLLSVSEYAVDCMRELPFGYVRKEPEILKYGCFHQYKTLPLLRNRDHISYSVGTVYPRKQVGFNAMFAYNLGMEMHHHYGRFVESNQTELIDSLKDCSKLTMHGFTAQSDLEEMMSRAKAYINMSTQEGFSMPPLEAIVAGVPYIYLSKIPVHYEIYGAVANMVDPHDVIVDPSATRKVRASEREYYFNKYSFEAVITPFMQFLR